MTSAAPQNRHGRKPGRGLRPWLLLPKVLAVAVYLGALASNAYLWFSTPAAAEAGARLARVNLVGRLFLAIVVPALLVTIIFGVLLWLQHPRVFIRMRWLRVKLAVLLVGVPLAHLLMSSRLEALRANLRAQGDSGSLPAQISLGFVLLLVGSGAVILLGRLKPRLGQNWARDFTR